MPYKKLISEIDRLATPHILVIGDAMLDHYLIGKVERISPEAPVPILHMEDEFYRVGGAANVAANITAIGARATLVALVGDDMDGEILCRHCRERNLIIEPLIALPRTVRKTRLLAGRQQILRVDREATMVEISPTARQQRRERLAKLLPTAEVILLSDYAKGMVDAELMAQLKTAGKKIIVDPRPQHAELYHGVTLITPNRKEAAAMARRGATAGATYANDAQLGAALRAQMSADILLTLGEDGMCLCTADEQNNALKIPTRAREVFDVTGAGDTVAAIFALATAAGFALSAAAYLANAAAGVVVGHVGAATVSLDELRRALAR